MKRHNLKVGDVIFDKTVKLQLKVRHHDTSDDEVIIGTIVNGVEVHTSSWLDEDQVDELLETYDVSLQIEAKKKAIKELQDEIKQLEEINAQV